MSAALVEAIERVKRDCPNAPFVPVPIAVAQSLTTRIAELEAENGRLRDGLREIAGAHLGDQPAASGGTEYDWAVRHISRLRAIARATLTETFDDR